MPDARLREALHHLPRVVVFVELARHGSFRGTAAALGLSPSTVSHHIQALEGALGVKLVERSSRAMSLTAAGEALLSDAQDLVRSWQRGVQRARLHAAAPTGRLVVTAPEAMVEHLLAPAVRRMVHEHPQVTVDLRVSARRLELMADGIDIAVRVGPLPDSGLGARLIYRDHHAIFAHPDLAAEWEPAHPSELDHAPWVQFSVREDQPVLEGPGGARHRLRVQPRALANTSGAFLSLVGEGLGFAVVPSRLAAPAVAAGRLRVVLPGWRSSRAGFYAVTRSPRPTDAKIVHFLDLLAEVAQGR